MDTPWGSRGIAMESPWSNDRHTMDTWTHHDLSMDMRSSRHGVALESPWRNHEHTMDTPWTHHVHTMAFP